MRQATACAYLASHSHHQPAKRSPSATIPATCRTQLHEMKKKNRARVSRDGDRFGVDEAIPDDRLRWPGSWRVRAPNLEAGEVLGLGRVLYREPERAGQEAVDLDVEPGGGVGEGAEVHPVTIGDDLETRPSPEDVPPRDRCRSGGRSGRRGAGCARPRRAGSGGASPRARSTASPPATRTSGRRRGRSWPWDARGRRRACRTRATDKGGSPRRSSSRASRSRRGARSRPGGSRRERANEEEGAGARDRYATRARRAAAEVTSRRSRSGE